MSITADDAGYLTDLERWRREKDSSLRAPDGWLSLIGLHWLNEGINTVGADESADVPLPVDGIPPRLGTITLTNGALSLHVDAWTHVTVDGVETREAVLRDSSAGGAPSMVRIGSITLFVIERGGSFAVRVRDSNNPAIGAFEGRRWYPPNPSYVTTGVLIPHEGAQTLNIVHSSGNTVAVGNPGRVEFTLDGETYAFEAFDAGADQVWFAFRDATNGKTTYGAGRFLYAPLGADASVHLDFNKAYHPPCAFTHFATCPLPPRQNVLPIEVRAGERL
jgi:uncharacterized protein